MPLTVTGTVDVNAIMQRLRKQQEETNQANLERYEALMTHMESMTKQVGEQGTYGAAMALMEQTGEAARTRIATQAKKATAAAEQDLISRGLGATTVRQAERRGIAATAEEATQAAEERTAAQKAGVLERRAGTEMQIGALKAGVMERREDVGPEMGMYASLIQAAAASETAEAKRTATVIGPQAQAGRDVFGQPMGGGGAAGASGAGLGAGGVGGGLGAAAGGAMATPFPPGATLGGPTGAARPAGGGVGAGGALGLPGLGAAAIGGYGGTPGQAVAAMEGRPSFEGGEDEMVSLSDMEVGPGGVPPEAGEAAAAAGGGKKTAQWWWERGLSPPQWALNEWYASGQYGGGGGGAGAVGGGAGVGGGVDIGLKGVGIGGGLTAAAESLYRQKKPTLSREAL